MVLNGHVMEENQHRTEMGPVSRFMQKCDINHS